VALQVSEFFLRSSFPYIFSGPLPVTGVILAGATTSDLQVELLEPARDGEPGGAAGVDRCGEDCPGHPPPRLPVLPPKEFPALRAE